MKTTSAAATTPTPVQASKEAPLPQTSMKIGGTSASSELISRSGVGENQFQRLRRQSSQNLMISSRDDLRSPNPKQLSFFPSMVSPLIEVPIEEELANTAQSFRKPILLPCVHHGVREYKHEGGTIKQEITTIDEKAYLSYYCEDCREFCCEYCISLGPHNNELHRVHSIYDFQERYQELIATFLGSEAKNKSLSLFHKIKQINARIELINNQAVVIERDAYIEFTHILERLNLAEGKKISMLQNDIGRLQRDINSIEDVVKAFENLASRDDRRMFLLYYRRLNINLTQAQSIRFRKEIIEDPYDLPRDIQAMKVQMENYKPSDEILKFKDVIIWGLMEEHKKELEAVMAQEKIVYSQKLEQWTRLARNTFQEFEELQLICHYCGELISDDMVNSDCFANIYRRDRDMSVPQRVYTDTVIEKGFFGSKRHYWVQPRAQDRQIRLGKLPSIEPGKRKRWNREIAYYNYVKLYCKLIKKKKVEKGLDLFGIFQSYDKEKTGYVSVIQFQYVLNAMLEIEEEFVTRATDFLAITHAEMTKIVSAAEQLEAQAEDLTKTFTGSSSAAAPRSLASYYAPLPAESQYGEASIEPPQPATLVNYSTFIAILDNPDHLEYEAFRIVNVDLLKQATTSYFISFDANLAKKFLADNPIRREPKNKFSGKTTSSKFSDFAATITKKR